MDRFTREHRSVDNKSKYKKCQVILERIFQCSYCLKVFLESKCFQVHCRAHTSKDLEAHHQKAS